MSIQEIIIDKQLLADLKDFFISNLTEQGVEKMFKGESVAAYPEAKDAIEKAFIALDDMGNPDKKPKVINNMAR